MWSTDWSMAQVARDRRPQRRPAREPLGRDRGRGPSSRSATSSTGPSCSRCSSPAPHIVIHMACDNLRASLNDPERTHSINATGTLLTALPAGEGGGEAVLQRLLFGGLRVGDRRRPRARHIRSSRPPSMARARRPGAQRPGMHADLRPPVIVDRPFTPMGPASTPREPAPR